MKGMDTPAMPQGAAAKTGAGALAGKGQGGRAGAAGREEGGLAFRSLLKALGGPHHGDTGARGKKEADGAEAASEAQEGILAQATPEPGSPVVLLLDALRVPAEEAPRQQAQPMPQPHERRGGAKPGIARELPLPTDKAASAAGQPASGPAMPTDARADLDTADLAMLAKLAQTDAEPAAPGAERGEARAPVATPGFTVTRQETYLPPVQKLSPFEQVVEPVRQAATDLFSARTQLADGLSGKSSEIATPTKILHIELKPVELGSIVVKMRLSQGGMDIRIETAKAETAALLAGDRETLREIVRASGHSIDAVSVETIHVDQLQSDRHNAAARQDNAQNDGTSGRDRQAFDQSRQGEQGRGSRNDDARPDPAGSKDMQDETDIRGRDAARYL